jgi:hypothetical protein
MIDAEVRSEERYSKISIGYDCCKEKELVNLKVNEVVAGGEIIPEIYVTNVSNGKEVMVIEYHDDYHRNSGVIFNKLIKELNIKKMLG